MAIICMGNNTVYTPVMVGGVYTGSVLSINEEHPEGAYCVIGNTWGEERHTVRGALILYTTHHGLCLYDYERNGYDDSDWYMVVWNEEKGCPETICFASTRGWTYPCYGSAPDATPEIVAKYDAWKVECERRKRVAAKWALRQFRRNYAAKCKITTADYDKLRAVYNPEMMDRLFKLLSAKLRSKFRISMAENIRNWLADPAPKYRMPLSFKQAEYV